VIVAPTVIRLGCSDDSGVEEVAEQDRRNDANVRITCSEIKFERYFSFLETSYEAFDRNLWNRSGVIYNSEFECP
jgi:hypothetical protein